VNVLVTVYIQGTFENVRALLSFENVRALLSFENVRALSRM
jgi:hypothetical protein